MELGLCKGKRFEERRETIKRREADLAARQATQRRR
jgi:tmRNA-binding protein